MRAFPRQSSSVHPSPTVVALVSAALLGLTACSALTPAAKPAPDPSVGVPKADTALVAKLPSAVKGAGVIKVATDGTYPPMDFVAGGGLGGQPGAGSTDAGGDVVGADVDLFNAVASKFGLTTEWTSTDFGSIIGDVSGGKYDVGVAAFTVNPDREKQATMVSYFAAGTMWVVAKGNPEKISADKACGKTVAVQADTLQADVDLPYRNRYCRAGDKITITKLPGQEQATDAVLTGKADATATDSPVAHYAVAQNADALQTVGQIYDVAPYGFVLPKQDKAFAQAMAVALQQLKDDGTYDAILKKWGIGQGLDDFAVNPSMG